MTDLDFEILRVLEAESGRQPLSADSIRAVLRAACGLYLADGEVEAALEALMLAGKVEAVHSIRLGPRYRVLRNDWGGMRAPETSA